MHMSGVTDFCYYPMKYTDGRHSGWSSNKQGCVYMKDQKKALLGITEDKLRAPPKLPVGLSLHKGNRETLL